MSLFFSTSRQQWTASKVLAGLRVTVAVHGEIDPVPVIDRATHVIRLDRRRTNREGNNMPQLKDKIAVVTGGSSGIGLATAKRFVAEGAYVFIAGRRQAELDKAVAEIGSNVTGVKTDIAKLEDLDRLYETVATKGKIDVIFAGAAFVEKAMTPGATPEHFEKTFNTNARGAYFTVQKALPHLNDGASVILVAAAGKDKGLPGRSTYSASKAAIRSFARTWTNELMDRKIRTNVISPGAVETPMFNEQFPSDAAAADARKQITTMTPLNRLGRPEEIAAAALFLASAESSFVAGIDLAVDGGLTAV